MAAPGTLEGQSGLRVLVVDSHSQSRKAAVSLLESCDYKVTAVATAKEALALLAADPAVPKFDLLLKDHDVSAGVNACRMLAKLRNSSWSNLPVVVCSDQDSQAEVLKCVNLGAADYLVKPLRRNEIQNLWTRVPVLVARFSESGVRTSLDRQHLAGANASAQAGSLSGSDDRTWCYREDGGKLTCAEGRALAANSIQQLQGKAGNGSYGDGSNGNDASATTPAHGSNNGQGASSTHVFTAGASYPAVHLKAAETSRSIGFAHDSSGDGGSRQESGNRGCQSQAAAQQLALESEEATPHATIKCNSSNGIGSSGVGDGTGASAFGSVAQKQQILASAVPRWANVSGLLGPVSCGVAEADACRGFRAWVNPTQPNSAARARAGAGEAQPGPPPSAFFASVHVGNSKAAPTFTELLAPAPSGSASVALSPHQDMTAAGCERFSSGATGTGTGVSTATQLRDSAHLCFQAGSQGVSSVQIGSAEAPSVTHAHQQQHVQVVQHVQQQEVAAATVVQHWPGGPAAQAHMQRLHAHMQQQQQQMSAQIMASFTPGPAHLGGLAPHVLAARMNPLGYGMRPLRPASRDDMPLPYGEHHLMQNGAQRMQAQQQAAVAKQVEMQQQLGATMLASYPGYFFPLCAMAKYGGMQPPSSWLPPVSAVQAQQMMHAPQHAPQQQHSSQPPQSAQSAQARTPPPGTPLFTASNPAASAQAGGALPGQMGISLPRGLPPSSCGGASMQGGPATSGVTNMTSGGPVGGSILSQPSHKERRAQALHKYKEKRKNLCFSKKIRYESRKQLAQARPRIKGQFVRMATGSEVELAIVRGATGSEAAPLEAAPKLEWMMESAEGTCS